MNTGPIHPLKRERRVSRQQTVLPMAWVGLPKPVRPTPTLDWLSSSASQLPPASKEATVLAALATDGPNEVFDFVLETSCAGRVYLLVPEGWNKAQISSALAKTDNVLVRRVPEVPAAAIHTGADAHLWVSPAWRLRLDEAQREALRRHLLRLFWHEAIEEGWSDGRQFVWRPAAERPFDVPDLPSSAPVRLAGASATLEAETAGAVIVLRNGPLPKTPPQQLWTPANGEGQQALANLVREGARVLWDETGLPDLVASDGGGEMLLRGVKDCLRVRLTRAQSAEIRQLTSAKAPRWEFRVDIPISEPDLRKAEFWLPGEAQARGIEACQTIPLPDTAAPSLREVSETEPKAFPSAQPLALEVSYAWTVQPPRLPSGSDDDALVTRWRETDQRWKQQLERAQRDLQACEGDRSRLGRLFDSLTSALLGLGHEHKRLEGELQELQARSPSVAGPEQAPMLFNRLAELGRQVSDLRGDLKEAERKAEEDAERKRQQDAWARCVEDARQSLPQKRKAMEELETKLAKLEAEIAEVEVGLKAEFKAEDKQREKDLKTRRHRLSDERKQILNKIEQVKTEITDREKTAAAEFQFVPTSAPAGGKPKPSDTGAKFVPARGENSGAPVIPDESLPSVGRLRRQKNQRYLVIENWDDLDKGEQEAARLSAKLVAPEKS